MNRRLPEESVLHEGLIAADVVEQRGNDRLDLGARDTVFGRGVERTMERFGGLLFKNAVIEDPPGAATM